jgi:hypothetical protein
MTKKTSLSAIITAGIGIAVLLYARVSGGDQSLGRQIMLASAMVVLMILIVITALLFRSGGKREYGKGVWIGGGVVLLIGFAVCTLYP